MTNFFLDEARRSAAWSCEAFGSSPEVLFSATRKQPHVWARQTAMWALRSLGWGVFAVGRYYGRDHSTVTHSVQAVEEWIDTGADDGTKATQLLARLRRYRREAHETPARGSTGRDDSELVSGFIHARSFATNDPCEPVDQLVFCFTEGL